jgi:hypothetical protein
MKATIVLAIVLAGCLENAVPSGDTSACERYADKFGAEECGIVYQFPKPAWTPSGYTEFCIPSRDGLLELAESMFGPAQESPRFDKYTQGVKDPPCAFQCPRAGGCNAYIDENPPKLGGCFCPFGADT